MAVMNRLHFTSIVGRDFSIENQLIGSDKYIIITDENVNKDILTVSLTEFAAIVTWAINNEIVRLEVVTE